MIDLLANVLGQVASKLVEIGVERVFTPATVPPPAEDPVAAAQHAIHGFLAAVAEKDWQAVSSWCDPGWVEQPGTAALLEDTMNAAVPLHWSLLEARVPGDWTARTPLPWLVCELEVKFDMTGGRYEAVLAVLRSIQTRDGWRINHLEWGTAPEEPDFIPEAEELGLSNIFGSGTAGDPNVRIESPEPGLSDIVVPAEPHGAFEFEGLGMRDIFSSLFTDPVVIDCAACGQKLSVPGDKGRLRVTCPKCSNVQWFQP